MVKLLIDGREVEMEGGATVLAAAAKLGIEIPTLCHWEGCDAQTSCLVCGVKINGGARLVPSCATVVVEGMEVESETAEVRAFRKAAIELILGEHAGDCRGPCENVCPAHMDIPAMLRCVEAGDLKGAVTVVKETIPLPATLGRICPELCEKGCRRAAFDQAVSICAVKRYVGDKGIEAGASFLPECGAASGKRVAIVGGGAAGLTAAWFLRLKGHGVVVFDERLLPGGAMRHAIGEERLPRAVLNAETQLIEAMGVEFFMNTRVDATMMEQLRRDFDAVLLTVGTVDKVVAAGLGVEFVGKGVKVDRKTMQTGVAKVFAAGGAVSPSQYAVRAVADGKIVAERIHAFLGGEVCEENGFASRMGRLSDAEMDRFFAEVPTISREVPRGGMKETLSDVRAVHEAARCGHCECSKLDSCRLFAVATRYGVNAGKFRGARREFRRESSHRVVVYEPGKCIACGLCVAIASKAAEPLGLTFVGRGFDVKVGVPLNAEFGKALERVARECVAACPTGALDLRYDTSADTDTRRVSLPQVTERRSSIDG